MEKVDDETLAALGLWSLARSGARSWIDALRRLKSARAVFAASDAELAATGLGPRRICALRSVSGWDERRRLRDRCAALGIGIAVFGSSDYPEMLGNLVDAPVLLYWRGVSPPCAVQPTVAIVGARRATRYGLRSARRVSGLAAQAGAWVVSGLANGIDAAAHLGALDHGRTAAVLAGGVDRCYPSGNRRLAEKIVATGVVLSEYPPGTPTLPRHFPVRNRIITGLAKLTVIVEAHERGGSLVSARLAVEQGREVMVLPGPIDSPASRGTNRLIADGGRPLLEPSDLVDALGLAGRGKPARVHAPGYPREPPNDAETAAILRSLDDEPTSVDELVAATRLDETVILEKLTSLELDGLAERLPGGTYVRCCLASEAREQS
jgi:DNA processing protein